MSLSVAPPEYVQGEQNRHREDLRRMDQLNRKKGQDVEIAGGERLILTSPNGTRWSVGVSDAGAFTATAI